MRITRRTIVATAGGLLAITALAGCGSVSATPTHTATVAPVTTDDLQWKAPTDLSGNLTIYAANPAPLTDALVAEFTKETGVTVTKYEADSGTITARLDSEAANPQADLVYLASWGAAAGYASKGDTLAYKPFGASSIRPGWADSKDEFVGRDGSALALVVNTDVAKATPKDWSDLTKADYKDQVIMPDPRQSGTAADLITAMVAAWGKDKTWDLFDKLFANGLVVQGANGPALDDVTAGSHSVILGGVDYSTYSAIAKGEPLKMIFPTSGTVISPRPIFIMKSSKNPAAAKAFEDFMFSAQGQTISATQYMIPSQPAVSVADGTRTFDSVKQLDFTWSTIVSTEPAILAEFTSRYLK